MLKSISEIISLSMLFIFSGCLSKTELANEQKNYVMLFTFTNSFLSKENIASKEMILTMNESPYDGFAATLTELGYEPPAIKDNAIFKGAVEELKKYCHKDIWPVCPLACIVQKDINHCHKSAQDKNHEMEKIKGMDLDNETGRLEKFYKTWKESLILARKLKSPGVIFDHEFYTNYEMSHIEKLAEVRKENMETIISKLETIGGKMAEIVSEIYPECKILILETMLYKPFDKYSFTPSHIILGLLKKAADKRIPLKVIDGGEVGLGYLHSSIESLKEKIAQRRQIYAPYQREYPNLELAGCIAPFIDKENRPYWMTQSSSPQFPYSSAEEFVPMIKVLLGNYHFVWIYAGWKTYMPFFPPSWKENERKPYLSHAERMNAVIREARKEAKFSESPIPNNEGTPVPQSSSIEDAIKKGAKIYFVMTGKIPRNDFALADYPFVKSVDNTNKVLIKNLKKTNEADFSLDVNYLKWVKGNYEWPGFSIIPSIRDVSGISGLIIELWNKSDYPVGITINVRDDKNEYPKKVVLDKNEKRLVTLRTDEMSAYIDTKKLKGVSFISTRPKVDFNIAFSDLFYYPQKIK
ncbi:MAG: hypothetical protein UT30_C0015G0007 [Candidatus Uhrbacteria bacterium GW2011_GWF2_39_13]|uniref:Uncharacterized protein n=1 Tax=Candidatus Uhrbacteria bacterium GW2011_GWF2_39_13 TaxID=1618995 RepID=A0A0G0MU63_9BACT|nr:MAG: hypothetical protein UT30_C0015G0007 [Candidatus Uhrbacteria bacterium GW2011_GWF2_39_13]